MKPRIRKINAFEAYLCFTNDRIGEGDTPSDAYEDWCRQRHASVRAPSLLCCLTKIAIRKKGP